MKRVCFEKNEHLMAKISGQEDVKLKSPHKSSLFSVTKF